MLIALPVALAFRGIIERTIGSSLSLDRFIAGFDATVLSDFLQKGSQSLSTLTSLVSWIAILYLLLTTFLDGGILGHLNSGDRKFTLASFFGDCGRYFLRYVRMTLLFGVLLVSVFLVSSGVFETIYDSVDRNAVSEVGVFYLRIGIFAATLFLVSIVVLMSDYARVAIVRSDARSAFRAALTSITFVFRKFFAVIGLQVAMVLVSLCVITAYLLIERPMYASTASGIITLLAVQQVTILLRTWVRVATFAGERHLYLLYEVPKVPRVVAPSAVAVPMVPSGPVPEPSLQRQTHVVVRKRTALRVRRKRPVSGRSSVRRRGVKK